MDRISCLAYILFQSENQDLKEIAIKLVSGDIYLKDVKANKQTRPHIEAAEKLLEKHNINTNDVCLFVEEYIYAI
ncbi:hypothetical protein [Bacillus sp. 03113]|uniref:hypothetical protein n=1 Tax=Bacillus sp. 03113 TaxID=2578211 RepID=UPI001141AAE7|nr:hypothetical protein [Bacillus sp. 03113]